MKKWLIYWIAENEEPLFILSFLFALIGVGLLGYELYLIGILCIVLFLISMIGLQYCKNYSEKHSKNIKQ